MTVKNIEVAQTFALLRRQMNLYFTQMLRPLKIGPKQASLLYHLSLLGEASPAQLSRVTLTDPAAVGRALEPLLRQKWVQRHEHKLDRRQWVVRLTAAGRKRFSQIESSFEEFADTICAGLSARERETLRGLLQKVSAQLGDSDTCE